MKSIRPIAEWFVAILRREKSSTESKQLVVVVFFSLGCLMTLLLALCSIKQDLSDFVSSLLLLEGAVLGLVSAVAFIYVNLDDDLLKDNRIEFMESVRDGKFETNDTSEQGLHYNNKLTELVIEITKNKLEEKSNYKPLNEK